MQCVMVYLPCIHWKTLHESITKGSSLHSCQIAPALSLEIYIYIYSVAHIWYYQICCSCTSPSRNALPKCKCIFMISTSHIFSAIRTSKVTYNEVYLNIQFKDMRNTFILPVNHVIMIIKGHQFHQTYQAYEYLFKLRPSSSKNTSFCLSVCLSVCHSFIN